MFTHRWTGKKSQDKMSTLVVQNLEGVESFSVDGATVSPEQLNSISPAYNQANASFAQANLIFVHANSSYDQANSSYNHANVSYSRANLAYSHANVGYSQANSSYSQANSSYSQANSSYSQANIAFSQANTAYSTANTISPLGQHTIWIPAAGMYTRTTSGAASGTVETSTNKVMIKTLDFDTTTQEFAQFAVQMPKSWNESNLICQFVWSHGATTTNFGVVWAIEAVSFADADVLDAAFGTAVQVADTGGTANTIYITSETSALTVAGTPAAEEYVVFQVKRVPSDGSDTMAIDARLHGVKIHYTIDAAKDD
jgi:hypothetical protein